MLAFAMSSGFTRAQVEAVAALANLDLDPSEVEALARQLGDILAYADLVQQVDTTGVPPTTSVVTYQTWDRPDEVRPSLDRDDVLANAPDPSIEAGLFKVPRVIG
jgi:aspartyl-tRNA(Asn)/glutamyl-tRNA(Gln) amidotransferase subunit C